VTYDQRERLGEMLTCMIAVAMIAAMIWIGLAGDEHPRNDPATTPHSVAP